MILGPQKIQRIQKIKQICLVVVNVGGLKPEWYMDSHTNSKAAVKKDFWGIHAISKIGLEDFVGIKNTKDTKDYADMSVFGNVWGGLKPE
jgi:hypothetical protein